MLEMICKNCNYCAPCLERSAINDSDNYLYLCKIDDVGIPRRGAIAVHPKSTCDRFEFHNSFIESRPLFDPRRTRNEKSNENRKH